MSIVAAVDWGGTWLRAALVDDRGDLVVQYRERCPKEPDHQLAAVALLVHRLAEQFAVDVDAVGIGIAGVVRDGRVITGSNLGLKDVDVREKLERRLALPVRVVNDIQAVALAELSMAGSGETAAFLSVGTGIGGAVIHDGRLLTGRGAAGDFGHMPVDLDGPRCACGSRGCLEQLASGRVLDAVARELAESRRSSFPTRKGRSEPLRHAGDLDAAANAGDAAAIEALERAASALAAGLRCIAAAYDPERVVLGGGLLSRGSYLFGQLEVQWAEKRSAWTTASLTLAEHGDDAGLRGAARLWAPPATPEAAPSGSSSGR